MLVVTGCSLVEPRWSGRSDGMPNCGTADVGLALSVLYLDDNAVNLKVVSHMLGALGVKVHTVQTAVEACELLKTVPFDLFLTDICMPDVSGFDVLGLVRRLEGAAARVPVVAITADDSRSRESYLAAGFDDLLLKPVSLSLLLDVCVSAAMLRTIRPASVRALARGPRMAAARGQRLHRRA